MLQHMEPVEAQDFRKITDRFRGIYGIYLILIKKKTERSQHGNRLGFADN